MIVGTCWKNISSFLLKKTSYSFYLVTNIKTAGCNGAAAEGNEVYHSINIK
jgi:hypothetical protein